MANVPVQWKGLPTVLSVALQNVLATRVHRELKTGALADCIDSSILTGSLVFTNSRDLDLDDDHDGILG